MSEYLKIIGASALALGLVACGNGGKAPAAPETTETAEAPAETAATEPEAVSAVTLDSAVTGDWRSEENKSRDVYRHPKETLEFFGIEPDDTVLEIWPGGGWYTEILAPLLKADGTYVAVGFDPETSDFARRGMEAFNEKFVSKPETFGTITVAALSKTSGPMVAPGTADAVLTFRNIHNWMAGEYADKVFADMYAALKPGGTLGVVEHRLNSADIQDPKAMTGYVHEDYVKQMAEQAGFVFVEGSEINANPKDEKDHPGGVWNLPPNLRTTDANGAEIEAYNAADFTGIGESDRMTLKFRKPTAEEVAAANAAAIAEETKKD